MVKGGWVFIVLAVLFFSSIVGAAYESDEIHTMACDWATTMFTDVDTQGITHDQGIFANQIHLSIRHVGSDEGSDLNLDEMIVILGNGVEVNYGPIPSDKNSWDSSTGGGSCNSDANDDCDPYYDIPPTYVKGIKTRWSKGCGSDDFYASFVSPFDENQNPWIEHTETDCRVGSPDEDKDGDFNCLDVDCVSYPACGYSCDASPDNGRIAVFQGVIGKPQGSFQVVESALASFGCRVLDRSDTEGWVFDFPPRANIDRHYGRVVKAKVYVYVSQTKTEHVRAAYDDIVEVRVYHDANGGRPEAGVKISGFYKEAVETHDYQLEFRAGWNLLEFYYWNWLGPGYGRLRFIDAAGAGKPVGAVFEKIQSWYVPNELICNDGVDDDSDGWTDMADWDCQKLCIGTSPPEGGDPLFAGDFLYDLEGYTPDNPAGPITAPSARSGADWCCGDDTALSGQLGVDTDYASLLTVGQDENVMLCLNDRGSDGKITNDPDDLHWNWWNAKLSENIFLTHEVVPSTEGHLTQLIANGDAWYYCAAANDPLLKSDARISEGDSLPPSDIEFTPIPYEYQVWPDQNCNQISDIYEAIDRECRQGDSSPLYCKSCPPDHQDLDCFGPMSFCEYKDSSHYVPHACQGLPTCGTPPPSPCQAGGSFTGEVLKDEWGYPSGSNCEEEVTAPLCRDGKDNDFDGKVDCADTDCYSEFVANQGAPPWDLANCPDVMETECNDGLDNDYDSEGAVFPDGLYDCDDPDCSSTPECVNPPESTELSPENERFVCYENEGKNYFAECCPTGFCYNIVSMENNAFWSHKEVFLPGVSYLWLNSVDYPDVPARSILDKVDNKDKSEATKKFVLEQVSGRDIAEIRLSVWFSHPSLQWKINYLEGGDSGAQPVKEYVGNGNSTVVWHTLVIPDSLIDDAKTVKEIEFVDPQKLSHLSVDNVFFKKKSDVFSDTRYCAATGAWISDLDQDAGACNAQNPQGFLIGGFGGTGWTGQTCCGDDPGESYSDSDRGCFNNNVILHDRVVGDLFRTERSLGGDYYEYKDLLFVKPKFYACSADGEDRYAQQMVGGPNQGRLVDSADNKGVCERAGSYFCAWNNTWQSKSKESEIFEWGGKLVRCRDGGLEEVSVAYDWFGRYAQVCDAGTCFCPTEAVFGETGYEDCDSYDRTGIQTGQPGRLDLQSCMPSGGYVNDHFCNAGNWTTRTGLVASFLQDFLVEKNKKNFVLTCNLPGSLLYEQYLGDEVGHLSDADIEELMTSACLLDIKDAGWKTENVIVGFALNIDKVPSDVGPLMDAAFSKGVGTRLSVNYEQVNGGGGDLPWDDCSSDGRCINADQDRFKVYFFGEKDLFFLSTVDLQTDRYPDPRNSNQSYFEYWQSLFKTFFQDLRVWAKPGILEDYQIPEISSSMERYYAAQRDMGNDQVKRVVVSVDQGWPEGAQAQRSIVTGRFKNFRYVDLLIQIAPLFPGSEFFDAGDEMFFYGPKQADPEKMIADLYKIRLDDIQ